MQGWIKLYRDIQCHWLWEDKPFDRRSAWIDILLMANHKDNKFVLGNEIVDIEKGSFITSELKLIERWQWSKHKVRNFLDLLEKDKMIVKKSDRKKTTITVVNYSVYQESETTEEPQKDYKGTAKGLQKDTNKNVKNDNNVNKDKNIVQISKADLSVFFEKLWKLYPNKKGKAQISDAKKKALFLIGEEKLIICIERYKTELKKDEWRKPQNGSTFFNSGYIDYLDENYEPCKAKKQTNNKFNNFDGRSYDIDNLEKHLLQADMKGTGSNKDG